MRIIGPQLFFMYWPGCPNGPETEILYHQMALMQNWVFSLGVSLSFVWIKSLINCNRDSSSHDLFIHIFIYFVAVPKKVSSRPAHDVFLLQATAFSCSNSTRFIEELSYRLQLHTSYYVLCTVISFQFGTNHNFFSR